MIFSHTFCAFYTAGTHADSKYTDTARTAEFRGSEIGFSIYTLCLCIKTCVVILVLGIYTLYLDVVILMCK